MDDWVPNQVEDVKNSTSTVRNYQLATGQPSRINFRIFSGMKYTSMNENSHNIKITKKILSSYIKKWRNILYSTYPINRPEATKAIKKACNILNLPEPQIYFIDSPREALSFFSNKKISISKYKHLKFNLELLIINESFKKFRSKRYSDNPNLSKIFFAESYLFQYASYVIYHDLYEYIDCWLEELIDSEITSSNFCEYDIYIEELNYNYDRTIWNALKILAQECPYIFYFTDFCLVIERPTELHLDSQNLIHAEGKPAVRFTDGYSIYAYHGIDIPEKYGKYSYSQWQSQWLVEEDNEELRSVIVREIGYEKFCQELPDSKFDFWKDYSLLITQAYDIIYNWFINNYLEGFFIEQSKLEIQEYDESNKLIKNIRNTIKNLFCKFPQELLAIDDTRIYKQIAPHLIVNPLPEVLEKINYPDWSMSRYIPKNHYVFCIFYGSNQSFYYILCNEEEKDYLPIWYVSKHSEPKICATNITSLLLTIAECYETGAYYVATNEKAGVSYIKQDIEKVEKVFRKFNPDYLNVWKEIWNDN